MLSVDQKMQISFNVLETTVEEIHNLVKEGVNMTPVQALSLCTAQEVLEKALHEFLKRLSSEPEEPPIHKTDAYGGLPCDVEP